MGEIYVRAIKYAEALEVLIVDDPAKKRYVY
jgi:hypothetical protein